jgi:hypothetical protein
LPELLTGEEVAGFWDWSYMHWNNSGELSTQKIGKGLLSEGLLLWTN